MSCTVPTAHAQSRLSQRGSTLALSLSPGACALFLVYVRSTMYVAVMCEAVMFEAVMCEPALYVRLLTNYVYTCVLVSLICTYVCMFETPAALWALMLSDLPPWSMCRSVQEACHSQVPLQKAEEGQHTL